MRSLAGYWHTGVGGGSRTEPRYLQKHGDLLEWGDVRCRPVSQGFADPDERPRGGDGGPVRPSMILPATNVALISRMTIDGIPQRPAWLELQCRRGGVERDRRRPHGPSKLGPPEWRSPPRRWSDSPPSPSRGSLTPRTLGTSLLQCWFIHGQDADRSESQREILATSSMRSVLS